MTDDSDSYAPFDPIELEKLAEFHDSVARGHPERSFLRHVHDERAALIRNAVLSYNALNQRCVESEAKLLLATLAHPVPWEAAS